MQSGSCGLGWLLGLFLCHREPCLRCGGNKCTAILSKDGAKVVCLEITVRVCAGISGDLRVFTAICGYLLYLRDKQNITMACYVWTALSLGFDRFLSASQSLCVVPPRRGDRVCIWRQRVVCFSPRWRSVRHLHWCRSRVRYR